jgi:uncharacterized protein YbaR (Trm112 family)
MYFDPSKVCNCESCGNQIYKFENCPVCETANKLKGVTCPCCKGSQIYLSQERQDNGTLGLGFRSWVVSEKFICKECGVMFVDVKKFKNE